MTCARASGARDATAPRTRTYRLRPRRLVAQTGEAQVVVVAAAEPAARCGGWMQPPPRSPRSARRAPRGASPIAPECRRAAGERRAASAAPRAEAACPRPPVGVLPLRSSRQPRPVELADPVVHREV